MDSTAKEFVYEEDYTYKAANGLFDLTAIVQQLKKMVVQFPQYQAEEKSITQLILMPLQEIFKKNQASLSYQQIGEILTTVKQSYIKWFKADDLAGKNIAQEDADLNASDIHFNNLLNGITSYVSSNEFKYQLYNIAEYFDSLISAINMILDDKEVKERSGKKQLDLTELQENLKILREYKTNSNGNIQQIRVLGDGIKKAIGGLKEAGEHLKLADTADLFIFAKIVENRCNLIPTWEEFLSIGGNPSNTNVSPFQRGGSLQQQLAETLAKRNLSNTPTGKSGQSKPPETNTGDDIATAAKKIVGNKQGRQEEVLAQCRQVEAKGGSRIVERSAELQAKLEARKTPGATQFFKGAKKGSTGTTVPPKTPQKINPQEAIIEEDVPLFQAEIGEEVSSPVKASNGPPNRPPPTPPVKKPTQEEEGSDNRQNYN